MVTNDEINNKLDQLVLELNQTQEELRRATRFIVGMTEVMRKLRKQVTFLEGRALEEKLDQLITTVNAISATLNTLGGMIVGLDTRLTTIEGKIDSLDNKVTNFRQQANNKLDSIQADTDNIQTRIP